MSPEWCSLQLTPLEYSIKDELTHIRVLLSLADKLQQKLDATRQLSRNARRNCHATVQFKFMVRPSFAAFVDFVIKVRRKRHHSRASLVSCFRAQLVTELPRLVYESCFRSSPNTPHLHCQPGKHLRASCFHTTGVSSSPFHEASLRICSVKPISGSRFLLSKNFAFLEEKSKNRAYHENADNPHNTCAPKKTCKQKTHVHSKFAQERVIRRATEDEDKSESFTARNTNEIHRDVGALSQSRIILGPPSLQTNFSTPRHVTVVSKNPKCVGRRGPAKVTERGTSPSTAQSRDQACGATRACCSGVDTRLWRDRKYAAHARSRKVTCCDKTTHSLDHANSARNDFSHLQPTFRSCLLLQKPVAQQSRFYSSHSVGGGELGWRWVGFG